MNLLHNITLEKVGITHCWEQWIIFLPTNYFDTRFRSQNNEVVNQNPQDDREIEYR